MKITRLAPAKVNLMLHVVGRLSDGYHHLQSLVTFTSIGDQVTFEAAKTFRLTVDGAFADQVPLTADNSVSMAVRWLEGKYPGIGQAHIHLTKNLPVASGIGGGSSDAAAAIAVLLQGFGISLSRADEEALILGSGALGADVPLCLAHQLGWGSMLWIDGSGRETLPVPLNRLLSKPSPFNPWRRQKFVRDPHVPLCTLRSLANFFLALYQNSWFRKKSNLSLPGPMLLINPGVSVSTPAIFKMIHPPYTMPQDFGHTLEKDFEGDLVAYLRGQKNDLMAPAIVEEPKIKEVMEALQNTPGCLLARMSGSGATCFALFEDEKTIRAAQAALLRKMPQAWGSIGQVYSFLKPQ